MNKLGKKPARHDDRTLKFGALAKYLASPVVVPASVDYTSGQTDDWGMMLNDNLGDCTIAAVGHAVQSWTQYIDAEVQVQDADILASYEQWCGYNPADPSTDQGGVLLDVLNSWRQNSFEQSNLVAFAEVLPKNDADVKEAIVLYGGVYTGLQLPVSAQGQDIWDVVPDDGGVWGGHCVWIPKFDPDYLYVVTWGAIKKMTWAFWDKYNDEGFALIGQEWINGNLAGYDLVSLQTDLSLVTG